MARRMARPDMSRTLDGSSFNLHKGRPASGRHLTANKAVVRKWPVSAHNSLSLSLSLCPSHLEGEGVPVWPPVDRVGGWVGKRQRQERPLMSVDNVGLDELGSEIDSSFPPVDVKTVHFPKPAEPTQCHWNRA